MFSSIRHIPHVHRLSSFCVTGYQHGRQETKTVTELKNISCRRSLSFCPPASTDYWNSCYFQAYELWNNGYSRFHSKTFKWHWRFKILLVSTGALSLDPPPHPPNSISSQHKHHKWQPWRTGYKPVGACTLSDGAKCQWCFRFWSIEFSSPIVVSKINTIFHSRPYYESLPHPECSSGTIYLYLTNVFLFFLGLTIRGGELKETFVSLQNLPCLGQKLLPFIVLLHW